MDLALRFTEAESSLERPDIAAFAAVDHALLREQAADQDDTSPLCDLVTAGVVASSLRMVDAEPARRQAPVFVRQRHWPIPAIATSDPTIMPVADEFVLDGHAHGHFAWPQQRASRAGAALVLAACIPMFLPDVALAQAAGGRQPALTAVVPAAPAAAPPPVVTPVVEASPTPVIAPGATPPGVPDLEAILLAMRGHEATVFAAGRAISGLVLGVEGDFVMMVDEARDGKIALIPKSQITEVRGRVGRSGKRVPLPASGTPQLVGGGLLTGFGGPVMLAGLVFLGISPSSPSLWLPMVLPAAALLGGGIPLLINGSRKRRAYNEAVQQNALARRLTPTFGPTRGGGWTGGLSLRF